VIAQGFDAGIMNIDIPKDYGGQGLGLVEAAILTEELAAACPGLATSIFDNSLGMEPLLLSKNEEIRKRYLPRILKDFKMICFATSEPLMGSDVAGIRCRAKADGDDFILNGTKYWITNGGLADYMSVFATVDPKQSHKGSAPFWWKKRWPGVRSGVPIPKMGQRCSNTVGLKFDNVRVPKANVLAPPGEGLRPGHENLRPHAAHYRCLRCRCGPIGHGVRHGLCQKAAGLRHAHLPVSRRSSSKSPRCIQKVETARLLTLKAAWEADQGAIPP
jgi:acyl-CoA dehydrogenase